MNISEFFLFHYLLQKDALLNQQPFLKTQKNIVNIKMYIKKNNTLRFLINLLNNSRLKAPESTHASPMKVIFSGFNGVAFFWRCHWIMPRSSKFSREIHRWKSLLLSSCVTGQHRTSSSLLETMQVDCSPAC